MCFSVRAVLRTNLRYGNEYQTTAVACPNVSRAPASSEDICNFKLRSCDMSPTQAYGAHRSKSDHAHATGSIARMSCWQGAEGGLASRCVVSLRGCER